MEIGIVGLSCRGGNVSPQLIRAGPSAWSSTAVLLDTADTARLWRYSSIISSWLPDLPAAALAETADLSNFSAEVRDSSDERWSIQAAVEKAVLASVLYARFRSRSPNTFSEELLSSVRFQSGDDVEAPRAPDHKAAEPEAWG